MATGIANFEKVSHRQLSGDLLVRNVDITGWAIPGKKLLELSQNGRLFVEVSGTTVNLYRSINPDGTFTGTELVATGTGAENALITLAEANSSGLSGYLRYTGSGTGDIIFTYATEDDVIKKVPGESQQLVWQVIKAALAGPRRMQDLLEDAKKKVDERLIREMQEKGLGKFVISDAGVIETVGDPFTIDAMGRFELATLANPEQLVTLHVWQTLREAAEMLVGSNEFASMVQKKYSELWHEEWQNLRLRIDDTANFQHDGQQRVSPVTYKPKRM